MATILINTPLIDEFAKAKTDYWLTLKDDTTSVSFPFKSLTLARQWAGEILRKIESAQFKEDRGQEKVIGEFNAVDAYLEAKG